MVEVRAYDKEGTLIAAQWVDDVISADGMAAGCHVQYECDTWVGETQIFSHATPFQRLVPGVLDDSPEA